MPTVSAPTATAYSGGSGNTAESSVSAVSWAAILGGAATAAAVTLVLVALGSGLGFASLSPWPNAGSSAASFTIKAGIWLIVVQWLASAIGGYMTGRLRTKWVGTHTHEVFFRDTAHGFLMWATASIVTAMLLASAASSVIGAGTRAASTMVSGAAQGGGAAASALASRAYDVDGLFRGAKADPAAAGQAAEVTRILASGITNGDVPAADKTYVTQIISDRTGISQADAQKRVEDVIAREKAVEVKAREAADAARKSASAVSIFTALSMLIGAFIASAAAALGGSLRDEHP